MKCEKMNIKHWQKIDASVQNKMKRMGERHLKGVLQIKFNRYNIQCHDNDSFF